MSASVDVLLRSVIDYAGTFPPAGLGLADAMASYARAAKGPRAAMLGRFVLPAARLDDFARLVPRFADAEQLQWPLSVVVSGVASELAQVRQFGTTWPDCGEIRAVEFGPHQAARIGALVEGTARGVDVFVELPIDANLEAGVNAVARHGAFAKVRTGGTIARAIPDANGLVRLMRACSDAGVAFKATAGLHHVLCGRHPLTYAADSARAPMFGFLNVALAAALIRSGASSEEVADALCESSPRAFTFTDTGVDWQRRSIPVAQLADTRCNFFRSFGSCAFDEPIQELAQLGLI